MITKTLNLGITGTRTGMTLYQDSALRDTFASLASDYETIVLHHGDCIGVDAQAAAIASEFGFRTASHPPIKVGLRAYHPSDTIEEPRGYFARNRDIVNSSEVLLVVPFQNTWLNHGGTWYTHDYAKKKGVPIRILWPEQSVLDELT